MQKIILKLKVFPLLIFLFVLAQPPVTIAAELYFVDAHSQMDDGVDQKTVIKLMDQGGVYRTILAARQGRSPKDVIKFNSAYPERIIPSVTTKKWGYAQPLESRHKKYYRALRNQLKSGRFRAMAEVLMWHDGCPNDKCPSIIVRANDKRVRAALKGALANEWPFVVHIEFGSLPGSSFKNFMDDLKGMLDANPDHPFSLIHMGQLEHAEVQKLIKAHKNIYFLAAHANPFAVAAAKGIKPWVDLFEEKKFAPPWRKLILEHPDRFIFALDNVWGEKHWVTDMYMSQINIWRSALSDLPENVANAVAHGNAERLWKISPKP
ncbi:MAG: amidohydrolase family protein [Nitrospinaceae bacterium]|jgi:hypothetical protein|nr:amidohydrolase family protein [Nitrospinaceae bacterium]MBT3434680.1 amidohydrolase family protein [Nitrospinaceae bacterium]MBT4430090.1 amidohydrolase family protein [Nitrospinaceae bacterium]MBT5366614.1 amidohydrolase family protein [Nitrospinaceae bacterium]MBT6394273.1 amidohydrolase family protein [Nitrospinaceae bacterium]